MRSKKLKTFLFITSLLFLCIGIVTFTIFSSLHKSIPDKPKSLAEYKEPIPPINKFQTVKSTVDTKDWATYTINNTFSIKYPNNVILDERQTVKGIRTAFIFKEDSEKTLPRNVPTLFIVDTGKKNIDGLTVYKFSDCKKPCDRYTV